MPTDVIQGYVDCAEEMVQRFESISSADLFEPIKDLLQVGDRNVIDIGAGTGRDAAWFAAQGCEVLAVEPVQAFREAGQRIHQDQGIAWLDDSLPDLSKVLASESLFDSVLMISLWHHLNPEDHLTILRNVSRLLREGGQLVISLRHGIEEQSDYRFPVSDEETIRLATDCGFELLANRSAQSLQQSNRQAGVIWTWLVFSVAKT